MKITVESTSKIIHHRGVPVRVWEGETERGVKMVAFIAYVAVATDADNSQFEAELQERHREPVAFDLRMIM